MSFSWTTINIGANIQASHFNEIKNNIDVLFDIACPIYSCTTLLWSEMPVGVGDPVRATAINEMRTATDAVRGGLPACSSENAAINTSDFSSNNYHHDSGVQAFECSVDCGSNDTSVYASNNSSDLTTIDNSDLGSEHTEFYTSADLSDVATNYGSQVSSELTDYNWNANNAVYGTNCSSYYPGNYSSVYSYDDSSQNSSAFPSLNSSVCGGHESVDNDYRNVTYIMIT